MTSASRSLASMAYDHDDAGDDNVLHRPFIGGTPIDELDEHDKYSKPRGDQGRSVIASGPSAAAEAAKGPSKHKRLVSLDVFRGLTICWMVLVDDAGETWSHWMDHSPWNGVRLADFVFPFFLWIAGVSMAMSFRKFLEGPRRNTWVLTKKVIVRFVKLFLIGLAVQGGYGPPDSPDYMVSTDYDLARLRIPGILQRIGWCYLVTSLIEIYTPQIDLDEYDESYTRMFKRYAYQWLVFAGITGAYLATIFGLPSAYDCTPTGDSKALSYNCNAAGYLDTKVLSHAHMYGTPTYVRSSPCSSCSPALCPRPDAPKWCSEPYDPEGMLTSISAIGSCFLGLVFGHVLINVKDHKRRLMHWVPLAVGCLVVGLAIDFAGFPLNKNMWSTSYVFFMAGVAGLLLTAFYIAIDVAGYEMPFAPLKWVGMNGIFVFVMAASDVFGTVITRVTWRHEDNNIITLVRDKWLVKWLGFDWGTLTFVLLKIVFWIVVAGVLKYKKIFFKV